jgi:hypothetical protein
MKANESLLADNQAGQQLLRRAAVLLENCTFRLERDRIVVFVCGGPMRARDGQPLSWRALFLRWFKDLGEDTRLEMFLAERAYEIALHTQPGFLNIGEFEKILGDLSDCILLFPESAGSHAEAGAFATSSRSLHQKVLVANEISYHNSSSFLTRGPLHKFGARSRFSQAIVLVRGQDNQADFEVIRERIESNALKNSSPITWVPEAGLGLRERLAVTLALVRTAGLLSHADLEALLKSLKLAISSPELHHTMRILKLFQQVDTVDRHVYRFIDDAHFRALIEGTRGTLSALSASFRSYYLDKFPRLLAGQQDGAAQ